MEHGDALDDVVVEAMDDISGARGRRVTLAGERDRDARVVGELGLQIAIARRGVVHQLGEVTCKSWYHGLRFRVTESHVVLDDLGTVSREHHPCVEDAAVVDAMRRRAPATWA